MIDPSFLPYRVAASYLEDQLKNAGMALPSVGVICGSGLSGLSSALEGPKLTIKYGDVSEKDKTKPKISEK